MCLDIFLLLPSMSIPGPNASSLETLIPIQPLTYNDALILHQPENMIYNTIAFS